MVTRTKEIECGISNIIDGLTVYDEQRSRAEAYAHMNNGQFELLHWTTEGLCP